MIRLNQWIFVLLVSTFSALLLTNFILFCWVQARNRPTEDSGKSTSTEDVKSFLNLDMWNGLYHEGDHTETGPNNNGNCRMETCFDFSACESDFKVYVYPETTRQTPPSSTYAKIISVLRNSKYVTDNPLEACLFIPSLDTLDRDPLSPNFGHFVAEGLVNLRFWNSLPRKMFSVNRSAIAGTKSDVNPEWAGRNHLLFNFYAGTWPNYRENEYRLWLGQAMLAKASISTTSFRSQFDISLPLIHSEHPIQSGLNSNRPNVFYQSGFSNRLRGQIQRPYLLSFKGKRYVSGIGSASRNALFHLHNGKDIIMLTTCRHGTDWVRYADKRCVQDMLIYDTFDYDELMRNSTFCLVPRGRRLGSYRFLEVLQAACIPVMLSNDWELPFSEVIDWKQAVIWADERTPLMIPLILRRLKPHQIVQLRQQVMFLWHTYFSSVESIVLTTLEIIRDRIQSRARNSRIWNSYPGALAISTAPSINDCDIPRNNLFNQCQDELLQGFTLIIPVRGDLCPIIWDRFDTFYPIFSHCPSIRKILLVWQCHQPVRKSMDNLKNYSIPIELVYQDERHSNSNSEACPSIRFQPLEEIPTIAVFAFHMDLNITAKQIEFAYEMWQKFPNRLIGFQASSHILDFNSGLWKYVADPISDTYSMVLLNAAFYHRLYHQLYWSLVDPKLHEIVTVFSDCEDILFNSLVSHLTQLPPIKIFNQSYTRLLHWPLTLIRDPNLSNDHLNARSLCVQAMSQHFVQPFSSNLGHDFVDPSMNVNNQTRIYLPLFKHSLGFYPPDE